jgi:hypothetical protein
MFRSVGTWPGEPALCDTGVLLSAVDHPLIRRLRSLRLDPADFVVFGSAPLLAHGLRQQISDLDVVARGRAWRRARQLGQRLVRGGGHSEMVQIDGGLIEISAAWITPRWSADELIDQAEVIDDIRYARLDQVLAYKRLLRRPKDLLDIARLEALLSGGA